MKTEVIWTPNPNVRERIIMGETLLLNIKKNRLLVFNEQASKIWNQFRHLNNRRELNIVKELQREYPNTATKKLEADVHNFFINLQKRDFVYSNKRPRNPQISTDYKNNDDKVGHLLFSERLHQRATEYNIPISGTLEITQRCSLKCVHCYIDNQPVTYPNELSTKEVCNLLEQITKAGCLWLLITGGEPLLRDDFEEIYQYAKELGMIVTIFTNAVHLKEKTVNLFTKYPPFLVEATLHGISEKTFDTISGVAGSFHRFQKGIKLLREHKIPFHLKMIVMRQNLHEVKAAYQFALKMGAEDFRFDPMINADFFHSAKVAKLRIDVEEAIKLDLLEPYRTRWKKIYRTALTKQTTYKSLKRLLFPCRAGKCSFCISADGRLLPCILMRIPAYNLRKASFSEAWSKLNHYTTTIRMKENNACLTCSVQTCSRCPAWGYLEHGDPNSKSQFACTLEQKRERLFLGNLERKGV